MKYLINLSIIFQNRNYGLLALGQLVSFLGTMITRVALPYQIYQLTHSTLMIGLLSFLQLAPLVVTALLGGVFADRHHRRMLLITTESILAVGCILLAINAIQAAPHIWVIFIVSAIMSAVTGLHRPALDSITQQIVAKKDLPAVGAINGLKNSLCMIGGPAIGGLIIANFGIVTTFLVDFATFLLSLILLLMMRNIPKPIPTIDESTWKSLKTGLKYAISRQELIGTYLVDFIAMVFGMPNALFPAIAESYGGAQTLGLLYSAPAVGALIMSLFTGWVHHIKRHGAAIAIVASLWGVSMIGFGLTQNFMLALFFLVLAGAFDGLSGVFRSIMWNETIPNHFRGRLSGIEMISYLSGPKLSDTETGLVAAAFGVTASIVSGGVLCVIGVGACCYFLPKFWRYRSQP